MTLAHTKQCVRRPIQRAARLLTGVFFFFFLIFLYFTLHLFSLNLFSLFVHIILLLFRSLSFSFSLAPIVRFISHVFIDIRFLLLLSNAFIPRKRMGYRLRVTYSEKIPLRSERMKRGRKKKHSKLAAFFIETSARSKYFI